MVYLDRKPKTGLADSENFLAKISNLYVFHPKTNFAALPAVSKIIFKFVQKITRKEGYRRIFLVFNRPTLR